MMPTAVFLKAELNYASVIHSANNFKNNSQKKKNLNYITIFSINRNPEINVHDVVEQF